MTDKVDWNKILIRKMNKGGWSWVEPSAEELALVKDHKWKQAGGWWFKCADCEKDLCHASYQAVGWQDVHTQPDNTYVYYNFQLRCSDVLMEKVCG